MQDRVLKIITDFKITKSEFAKRINVSQAFVSQLCAGARTPSDRTIKDICREFRVSEAWLRDGTGEMLVRQSADEELALLANDLMAESSDTFRRRFLTALLEMPPESWPAVERFLQRLLQSSQPDAPADQELPPE